MILTIQWLSGFAMLIIMLLVTLVIYPQFGHVPIGSLQLYAQKHVSAITMIVLPIMLIEFVSLLLCWTQPSIRSVWLLLATLALLAIWLLTFAYIVPTHSMIQANPSTEAVVRLNSQNNIRMALYAFKCLCITFSLLFAFAPIVWAKKIDTFKTHGLISPTNSYQESFTTPLPFQSAKEAIQTNGPNLIIIDQNFKSDELHQTHEVVWMDFTPLFKFPDIVKLSQSGKTVTIQSQSLVGRYDFGKIKIGSKPWLSC